MATDFILRVVVPGTVDCSMVRAVLHKHTSDVSVSSQELYDRDLVVARFYDRGNAEVALAEINERFPELLDQ